MGNPLPYVVERALAFADRLGDRACQRLPLHQISRIDELMPWWLLTNAEKIAEAEMNTLEPNERQLRPSFQDVRNMLDILALACHPLSDPSLAKFLTLIRERYANGSAHLTAFDIGSNPVFHWFASRNRLEGEELLARMLTHTAIRAGLPDLGIPQAPQLPAINFERRSSFWIDGLFAQILYQGGAHWMPSGTGESEKLLALDVCRALFGFRYAEICAYVSYEPWTKWFKDVAWDCTLAFFDKRHARLFLLVATDTD